jgi:hypothetical protein
VKVKEAKNRERDRAQSHDCTHMTEKIIDVGQEKEAKRRARARARGGQDTKKELGHDPHKSPSDKGIKGGYRKW